MNYRIISTYDICERFVVIDRGEMVMETDKTQISGEQLVKELQAIARAGRQLASPGRGQSVMP